jgi:hypothetical protein
MLINVELIPATSLGNNLRSRFKKVTGMRCVNFATDRLTTSVSYAVGLATSTPSKLMKSGTTIQKLASRR